jgi:rhodanese-related sulfurtransferase
MNSAPHTRDGATRESLSPDGAARLLATGGQLVDLCSPAEFTRHALPGALNLPVDALSWQFARLNRRRPVILCADDAIRCFHAAQFLAGEGFTHIYRMSRH